MYIYITIVMSLTQCVNPDTQTLKTLTPVKPRNINIRPFSSEVLGIWDPTPVILLKGPSVCILKTMRYNIYIRKEDEYLWEKIENKSEWIRERLHEKVPTPTEEEFEEGLEGEPTDDLRIT